MYEVLILIHAINKMGLKRHLGEIKGRWKKKNITTIALQYTREEKCHVTVVIWFLGWVWLFSPLYCTLVALIIKKANVEDQQIQENAQMYFNSNAILRCKKKAPIGYAKIYHTITKCLHKLRYACHAKQIHNLQITLNAKQNPIFSSAKPLDRFKWSQAKCMGFVEWVVVWMGMRVQ